MRMRFPFARRECLIAMSTVTAMGVTAFAAAPGGAAQAPEKEYTAHFEAECVLGPGIFNEKGTIKVTTRGTAPEAVSPGEEVGVKSSTITVVTPKAWGESLYALGVREARGLVTSTVLDVTGAEPARINAAKPAEFPEGLPFKTPVEQKEVEFTVPSEGRTFGVGPFKVTGQPGEKVTLTVDTAPGYKEAVEGYESTGEGIQSETSGYGAQGEHKIGPITTSCNAPPGVVEGEVAIVAPSSSSTSSAATETTSSSSTTATGSTSSTSSSSASSSTTTSSTSSGAAPVIEHLEPESGPVSGGTPVRIVGLHLSPQETRCVTLNISECHISVHFGSQEATVLADSPTNVLVTAPAAAGPGTVPVTVTVDGVTNASSSDGHYTYKDELEEKEEKLEETESAVPTP
jgi:hypothetical protein